MLYLGLRSHHYDIIYQLHNVDTQEVIVIQVLTQVQILFGVIKEWQPVYVDEQCNLEILIQGMHHQDIILQQSAKHLDLVMFACRASKYPAVSFIDQLVELFPASPEICPSSLGFWNAQPFWRWCKVAGEIILKLCKVFAHLGVAHSLKPTQDKIGVCPASIIGWAILLPCSLQCVCDILPWSK